MHTVKNSIHIKKYAKKGTSYAKIDEAEGKKNLHSFFKKEPSMPLAVCCRFCHSGKFGNKLTNVFIISNKNKIVNYFFKFFVNHGLFLYHSSILALSFFLFISAM